VVDAIHKAVAMKIEFPKIHGEQAVVAQRFKDKSEIDIDTCVGVIDGILMAS
jgi:hypothetical protein